MSISQFNPHDDDDLAAPVTGNDSADLASDVIRQKLDRIYAEEPDAAEELAEAGEAPTHSKHQQFMLDLSKSGKDLATIQTEWHAYYAGLPDDEKHAVWQEFYNTQPLVTQAPRAPTKPDSPQALADHKNQTITRSRSAAQKKRARLRDVRNPKEVQAAIRDTVTAGGQLKAKHHVQSLLFGLGMGAVVVIIFLFSFFNEVIIAPFIQPSRAAAATPLIVSTDSVAPTSTPEVIIPKINVEIPVDYTQTTTEEAAIENALENGIVHYPTTVHPGETGNAAYFGHSSNNIFNKGKYKFAFVMLHTLVKGDTFYLTYNGKVYVYEVVDRKVVEPSEVGVLGPVAGYASTATLITCDPPGTSLHRLVVVGKQIRPDPAGNTAAQTPAASPGTAKPSAALPGNGPTLLGRVLDTALGKLIFFGMPIGAAFLVLRRINRDH